MMNYYQTLLEATTDPQNSKSAFKIFSSSERSDLDEWVGAHSSSETRAKISRSTELRIHIVDPNIGSID